jgi:hypothetical protein
MGWVPYGSSPEARSLLEERSDDDNDDDDVVVCVTVCRLGRTVPYRSRVGTLNGLSLSRSKKKKQYEYSSRSGKKERSGKLGLAALWLFSIALDHTSIARSVGPSVAPAPNAKNNQGREGSRIKDQGSRIKGESLPSSSPVGSDPIRL